MKFKKNKVKLDFYQGFYLLDKFGLVLIYILKFYCKKSSSILLKNNMFNLLIAFFHYTLFKYFYIIPNVMSVWFGLYSIRIFFLSFFLLLFLFISVFSLTDTNYSQHSRKGRGNHYFSCFLLPPAHEHSFSSSRFLPLFLIDLFVITRLIADEACSH